MSIYKRYKHFSRYREITNILLAHGFGYVIDILGLREFLPFGKRVLKKGFEKQYLTIGERIRIVLEELGPTFIKFGQLLSTRPDLVPRDILVELEKLQDNVPAFDYNIAEKQIEDEIGVPCSKIFKHLEKTPLAAASIGQVHKATLKNGKDVVIKIQRPNINEKIEKDLDILFDLARIIDKRTELRNIYNLTEVVEEFARVIREEMDYSKEGRNAERFKNNLKRIDNLHIPEVYWDYSTKRILCLELIEGKKISDIEGIKSIIPDTSLLAKSLANLYMKQILIDGFYHADPHPGNIFISFKGSVVLMDFGMVGIVDEDMKYRFINLMLSIFKKDVDSIARLLLNIGIPMEKVDFHKFKRDIKNTFMKYYRMTINEISLRDSFNEIMDISYEYKIVIPSDFILLIKTIIGVESLIKKLNPDLNITELFEQLAKGLIKEKYSIKYFKKRILDSVEEVTIFLNELPNQINKILDKTEKGELKLNLEHSNISKFMARLDIISNRLSFSIIVGSLIIGSSLIAQGGESQLLSRYPIAEFGFVIAGILGLWVLFSIVRYGKY